MTICDCVTGLRGDSLCPVCNGTPDSEERDRLDALTAGLGERLKTIDATFRKEHGIPSVGQPGQPLASADPPTTRRRR